MKLNVGYQITQSSDFVDAIISHKDRIKEVYFAWGDLPNGRHRMDALPTGEDPERMRLRQSADLSRIAAVGISTDLLLNASCYGSDSLSRSFFNKLGDTVDELCNRFALSAVTTTSPLIASFIKQNFATLSVRASVNMEIGTLQGMRYLADRFDSFYMKREYNRDLKQIKELTAWCRDNGKELLLLANSGCLNHCSAHTFHDNLVSHEAEILRKDNAYGFAGLCWEHLAKADARASWLADTNFIRPEDLFLYEPYFQTAKLATRVNASPLRILRAYLEARYVGPITDLLEPNHGGAFYPSIVENRMIDREFAARVWACSKNCAACGYCVDVQKRATVELF